jgi:hypothetical protein
MASDTDPRLPFLGYSRHRPLATGTRTRTHDPVQQSSDSDARVREREVHAHVTKDEYQIITIMQFDDFHET